MTGGSEHGILKPWKWGGGADSQDRPGDKKSDLFPTSVYFSRKGSTIVGVGGRGSFRGTKQKRTSKVSKGVVDGPTKLDSGGSGGKGPSTSEFSSGRLKV